MTDIVERLKYHQEDLGGRLVLTNPDGPEAAREIARLRANVERLRAQIRFGSCATRITNNGIEIGHCTLKPEVERLRADNERLRAALRRVEGLLDSTDAALSIAIREAKEAPGDE